MVACVGGGSNAIGMFVAFLDDAGGGARRRRGGGARARRHRARRAAEPGTARGAARVEQLPDAGRARPGAHRAFDQRRASTIPGVGPEHSALRDSGRVRYVSADDEQALAAFHRLCRLEGIIPALESSHALHAAEQLAAGAPRDAVVVVCLSGRGDKDIATVRERDGDRDDAAG